MNAPSLLTRLALSAPLAFLPACVIVVDANGSYHDRNTIRGSGVRVTEQRDASDFSRVQISGSGEVTVEVGGQTHVTVSCDDNLIQYVTARVEDGTLRIGMEKGSYSFRKGPDIHITTPELVALSISGSADTSVRRLEAERFEVHVSGSADVRAEGQVEYLEASVSGSGDLNLKKLKAQEAVVRVSGSGDVDVTVVRRIDAEVSGSGDITYRGEPKKLSTSVSGSGSIRRR